MQNQLFESALGITKPWYVRGVDFDAAKKVLTITVDFVAGTRFAVAGVAGVHPVHDTQIKRLRHLNFFQHECFLEVRTPRVKLPDGKVVLAEPAWFGKLAGFTLLFEALVLAMAQQMTFAAVAKLVDESWHRVHAICSRYVNLALAEADLSAVTAVAIDETSCRRGHNYLTITADTDERKVVFVTEGKDAKTVADFAADLAAHKGTAEQVRLVSIDMSPAFIKGVADHLPNARITFDKFHVVAHASTAVDKMRRLEQRTDPSLKGLRWTLLKDRGRLSDESRADLDTLIAQAATKRTARAWLYREHLRDILDRKQINVVSAMLKQWCTNVLRSRVEPMKEVARMIRKHFDGIVAWTQTRQTNGYIEALNGLFQAAKRKARGYTRFTTMRTVLFLIAGKLDFTPINPHAA
ncbi:MULTISPECIES: ISL3 family transposase [unclassified Bradyrhizobium]|uniref:ISL3 family transposase n=1 Tax=unclassified Bradyrhizobium TaxID=2631580 RepID=UPI0020B18DFE|nr:MULTISPECIES: ISL3 family transposase [unclassified Bradyrhizobium]MCP3380172.1 ISL3 family transposase [Bradyrhizobium sp. CCGUVB4N]MCP3380211.1 ISL3 family transposase [Bradyrhizobium sp. CCGUVB4N]MCP3380234.1 ISL3 family transposase [Bradyrhizobium sp. CCGUVB4N]MCP3380354.1 ISL3 family transposase [Bradyrhizobium sp. CCGUVB4N]MCP3380486.1 ISL3 family transposase [Bradyrhizobium sp. CCGUVB4N]